MFSLPAILGIAVAHFVADFPLQVFPFFQRFMGHKHEDWGHLGAHVTVYTACILIPGMMLIGWTAGVAWAVINGLLHGAVDAVTSRMTHRHYDNKRFDLFFLTLGADQLAHTVCLFSTLAWFL